jgi:hypothetical protein
MLKRIIACGIVLVAAAPAALARDLGATEIAGRWSGPSYGVKTGSILTLDIVACGAGWCGIRVEAADKCGGTALKLGPGIVEENTARFEGTFSLAAGTEPYTVHAAIFAPEEGKPLQMQVTGDTGGEYRAFRRSFPFEAGLARVQDAVCRIPETVSALQ